MRDRPSSGPPVVESRCVKERVQSFGLYPDHRDLRLPVLEDELDLFLVTHGPTPSRPSSPSHNPPSLTVSRHAHRPTRLLGSLPRLLSLSVRPDTNRGTSDFSWRLRQSGRHPVEAGGLGSSPNNRGTTATHSWWITCKRSIRLRFL